MHYSRLNFVAVVLVCLTVGSAEGQSLGRWRMPSTPAQFFGLGYGPGHHAPMVRMPCCTPMSVQRLDIVHSYGCQSPGCSGSYGYGGVAQSGTYGSVPVSLPYYAGNGMVLPVPGDDAYSRSHHLLPTTAHPLVPRVPPANIPVAPSEPTAVPLSTPVN